MSRRQDLGAAPAEPTKVERGVQPAMHRGTKPAQGTGSHKSEEAQTGTVSDIILTSLHAWLRNLQVAADSRYQGPVASHPISTDSPEALSNKSRGVMRALVTKELRGARKEDEFSQRETGLTIGRAWTIVVVPKRKRIAGEMTTAGGAQRRSGRVPDQTEIEDVIEAEIGETDLMGRTQQVELSSLARSLCRRYQKLKQQQCGQELH